MQKGKEGAASGENAGSESLGESRRQKGPRARMKFFPSLL